MIKAHAALKVQGFLLAERSHTNFAGFGHSEPSSTHDQEFAECIRVPRPRRTYTEIERPHKCPVPGCAKAYGRKAALVLHLRLKHTLPEPGMPRIQVAAPSQIDDDTLRRLSVQLQPLLMLHQEYQRHQQPSSITQRLIIIVQRRIEELQSAIASILLGETSRPDAVVRTCSPQDPPPREAVLLQEATL